MNISELKHNSGYWVSKIQIDLYHQLNDYIKNTKSTQTKFAEKIGVTKGYISQVLNGNFDFRISKLVELSLAIGKIPKIEYEDIEKLIYREEVGFKEIKWEMLTKSEGLNTSAGTQKGKDGCLIVPIRKFNNPIVAKVS